MNLLFVAAAAATLTATVLPRLARGAVSSRSLRRVHARRGGTLRGGSLYLETLRLRVEGRELGLRISRPPDCPQLEMERVRPGEEFLNASDIRLGDQDFDDTWVIRSSQASLLEQVFPRRLEIPGWVDRLLVLQDSLELRGPTPDAEVVMETLDRLPALVASLQRGRWSEQAESLGLKSRSMRRMASADGSERVTVTVRGGRWQTTVRLREALPFRAWHTEHRPTGYVGEPSHNPVADQLIGVQGDTARLQGELEGVLELVHGFPGSTLDYDGLTVVLPRLARGPALAQILGRARRLVRALSEGRPHQG